MVIRNKDIANREQKRQTCLSDYAEMQHILYKDTANRAQKRQTCLYDYAEMQHILYKDIDFIVIVPHSFGHAKNAAKDKHKKRSSSLCHSNSNAKRHQKASPIAKTKPLVPRPMPKSMRPFTLCFISMRSPTPKFGSKSRQRKCPNE